MGFARNCGISIVMTSNNQMLWSGGDNDRRSKCFGSSAVLYVSFTDGQNTRDQITSDRIEIEGSNAQ